MTQRPRHVVVEGLPAVGKSELLSLLARFYPQEVVVLPEMVKELVERHDLDLFMDRAELTAAIAEEIPRRRRAVEEALASGALCLEESHLAVHLAYSRALGDEGFDAVFESLQRELPAPDLVIHLELPVAGSVLRQRARGTPAFEVGAETLEAMLDILEQWHEEHGSSVARVDADRGAEAVVGDLVSLLGLQYAAVGGGADGILPVLLLLGRPASGKSELIDFMQRTSRTERAQRYHLGALRVLDDFPILWELFVSEDAWERAGRPRRLSRRAEENYCVADDGVWGFLIERLNDRLEPILAAQSARETVIVEFARGRAGGYADAIPRLLPRALERAAVLYVDVSFEESWRRNVARYDERRRSGILTHSVPRDEMERSYGVDDWHDLTEAPTGTLSIRGFDLPYVTMCNEPELVDRDGLDRRYRGALGSLYEAWVTLQGGPR
ncbi:MAG: AAA family ATPase [Candidatus Bipolaricaulota bacterium]|nr:MAG: AAA family ATPase [Candidatus Bipolaricaulota bacterium]